MTAAIATTIPSASSATESTASTTTAAGTIRLGTRFIHIERASANLAAVNAGNRFLAFLGVCHLDKAEAARTASIAISHDADTVHLSIGRKQLSQFIFPSVKIQIADENILQANSLELSYLNVATAAKKRRLVGLT